MSRDAVEVLAGGEVLVSGDAVPWLATVVERAVHAQRRNGMRSAIFEGWLDAFALAVALTRSSAIGRSELPIELDPASSALVDPVSTSEAAMMLTKTPRNVVDLCRREVFTSARKVGGQWQIERAEVAARAETRVA